VTRGQQLRQICVEERELTVKKLCDALPEPLLDDAASLMVALIDANNQWINEQDRTIDHRILPAVLRMLADENDRIYPRLEAAGLVNPSEHGGDSE
jgi:hypothetical protein